MGTREEELAALVAFRKRTVSRCMRAAEEAASVFEEKGKAAERDGALAATRAIEAIEAEVTEQEPGAVAILERDRKYALLKDALAEHLWLSPGFEVEDVELRGKELKAFREGMTPPIVNLTWDGELEGFRLSPATRVSLLGAEFPENAETAVSPTESVVCLTLSSDEILPIIAQLAAAGPDSGVQIVFASEVYLRPAEEYWEHPLRAAVEDAATGDGACDGS